MARSPVLLVDKPELSAWVECCVVPSMLIEQQLSPGSRVYVTGGAGKDLCEQAVLALLWARLYGPELRGAERRLDLTSDEILLVHLSPGSMGASRSRSSRLLGAAMATSMACLMTGAARRQGHQATAVVGELLCAGATLGGWVLTGDESVYLRNVGHLQGILRLLASASTAARASLRHAAEAAGVELLGVTTLTEGMDFLLPHTISSSSSSSSSSLGRRNSDA